MGVRRERRQEFGGTSGSGGNAHPADRNVKHRFRVLGLLITTTSRKMTEKDTHWGLWVLVVFFKKSKNKSGLDR